MIRAATLDDMPEILRLGREFLAYSPNRWIPLDEDAFTATCEAIIAGAGAIFLSEDGFIGGVVTPCYFNPAFLFGSELFWFARVGGQELREAWEGFCRERGVAAQTASGLVDDREPAIRRAYRAAGYEATEIGFMKRYR
jgi:hypothetical protein